MQPIYQQDFTITDLYVDRFGYLLPSKLLYIMQEVAGKHFDVLAMDYDSLAQRGLFWAVTRHKVQITRLPRSGETIHVETWPMPTTRVAYPRSVVAYDEEGNECFRAITLWVLMDMNNRSMILPGQRAVFPPGSARQGPAQPPLPHRQLHGSGPERPHEQHQILRLDRRSATGLLPRRPYPEGIHRLLLKRSPGGPGPAAGLGFH